MPDVGGLVQGRVTTLVDGVDVRSGLEKQLHHPRVAKVGGQVERRLVQEVFTATCPAEDEESTSLEQ